MTSKIVVNNIEADAGVSTVTFGSNISGNFVGSISVSGVTTVAAGSASAPSISPTGDSNTGIFFPSADTIAFAEGGVEALRITSASRVGLGTNIPDSYDSGGRTLVVDESGSLAGMTIRSSTQGAVYFADGLTGNEAYRGRIEYSHSTDALNFGTAGTGSKLSITSGGNVQIANGNLVFSTSGTGIDFSATGEGSGTMTSELLDDYEEGTWTPTLTGTSGGSYTSGGATYGWYRKVGNLVTVGGTLQWTAQVTAYSGLLIISGLPYTNGANRSGATIGSGSGLSFSSGYSNWASSIDIGGSAIYILQVSSTNNTYSHNPVVSTSGIIYGFMCTYGTT